MRKLSTIINMRMITFMKKSMFCLTVSGVTAMMLSGCAGELGQTFLQERGGEQAALTLRTRAGDAAEAEYSHRVLLSASGTVRGQQAVAGAAAIEPFYVDPGSYDIYAVAASDESNLDFTGFSDGAGVLSARIAVKDMSADIPDLMVGTAQGVAAGTSDVEASLTLVRAVAGLSVTVSGLESLDAESITLTVGNMYNAVDLTGAGVKDGESFASKTLVLARGSDGKYAGKAVVMPTDGSVQTLALTYGIDGRNWNSSPEGRIAANGQYELAVNVTGAAAAGAAAVKSSGAGLEWHSVLTELSKD